MIVLRVFFVHFLLQRRDGEEELYLPTEELKLDLPCVFFKSCCFYNLHLIVKQHLVLGDTDDEPVTACRQSAV